MRKKRVMFLSEWSELSSGYSVYYKNIIKRLFDTGKYEILELANYAVDGDQRLDNAPWQIIPVVPNPQDSDANRIYNSNPIGQFGLFKFEEACLKFLPDIVISIFDYWYSDFVLKSPFRNFFKMIWMPTVDSKPQRHCWIDAYSSCDKICSYSYFGKNVLENESGGKIKNVTVCSPGIDSSYLPSTNKSELKKRFDIEEKQNIVMMVCRNQMRKLICDFIESARVFIDKYSCIDKELVDNTYFYIHTSNPDHGWEIEQPIINSHVVDKILVTYFCKYCGNIKVKKFCGILSECKNCNKNSMQMTSVGAGIPRQAIADLMSIADLGALLSIGEGFGMPIIEFKKVGVPVITVPWSAMEEQCIDIKCGERRDYGGIPVKIQRMYTEATTMQQRALFDKEDFADKVYEYLNKSSENKKKLSDEATYCANTYFTWDKCSNEWEKIIDSIDISNLKKWDKDPPVYFNSIENNEPPKNIADDAEELIRWCVDNWYPHRYFTEYRISEFVNSIVTGASLIDQFNKERFSFDSVKSIFRGMIDKHNHFERIRESMFFKNKTNEDVFDVVKF